MLDGIDDLSLLDRNQLKPLLAYGEPVLWRVFRVSVPFLLIRRRQAKSERRIFCPQSIFWGKQTDM